MLPKNTIPEGFCQCGCGAPTNRIKRAGKPFARYRAGHQHRKSDARSFVHPVTNCHIWLGAKTPAGYGRTTNEGKEVYVHRMAYEMVHGPIPPGYEIDHLCRNPSCFNPNHLEAVTHAENVRRSKNTILVASNIMAIKSSDEPQTVLAERYGIDASMISHIRSGKKWCDI